MAQLKAWQLMMLALSELGEWRDGQATGGSATTIVDTVRPNGEDPAQFQNGTAIITYDAAGAGAAPEGEWSRITSYANASKTFTLSSTLTAAVASGDNYVVSTNFFQHNELIRLMNEALRHRKLGSNVPTQDTSITTANNQTEYTLPVAIKEKSIRQIWYNGLTGDANDTRPIRIENHRVTWSAGGSAALLILPQLPADRTVTIEYLGVHPAITAASSNISEYIPPDLATALYVERLANTAIARAKNKAEPFAIGYDKAAAQLEEAFRRNWPLNKPKRYPKMTVIGNSSAYDPGTPGTVRL